MATESSFLAFFALRMRSLKSDLQSPTSRIPQTWKLFGQKTRNGGEGDETRMERQSFDGFFRLQLCVIRSSQSVAAIKVTHSRTLVSLLLLRSIALQSMIDWGVQGDPSGWLQPPVDLCSSATLPG